MPHAILCPIFLYIVLELLGMRGVWGRAETDPFGFGITTLFVEETCHFALSSVSRVECL